MMEIPFVRLGGPTSLDLVNLRMTGMHLVGATMGSSGCPSSGLVFKEGSPPFSTAAAPYNGTFKPYGDVFTEDGTFSVFKTKPANGTYEIFAIALQAPVTFECFVMELDLE
jgi:hypothetical protein